MYNLIALPFQIVIGACFLWIGMKATKVNGTFVLMLAISTVSSAVGFVPIVGGLLSIGSMFVLIRKLTNAKLWPDTVLMVLVAGGAAMVGGLLIVGLMSQL